MSSNNSFKNKVDYKVMTYKLYIYIYIYIYIYMPAPSYAEMHLKNWVFPAVNNEYVKRYM